jgi:subtilisin-like proprotein convertase family protein
MRNARRTAPGMALAAITAALLLPAVAQATVVTLSQDEGGSGINWNPGDPSLQPGDVYPSTITGPAGTVNDVNVNVQESHANPDDLDVELVSPNGTAVFLLSDACGSDNELQTLKFDDSAAGFLSDAGPCDQSLTFKPSNYTPPPGTEVDVYSAPAPAGLPLNALSFFNGGPSGGAWRLFAMDDTTGNIGSITVWSIILDYTPAPATTPPGTTPGIGNPTSPTNPAGNLRPRCNKKKKHKTAVVAKKKCKKKRK